MSILNFTKKIRKAKKEKTGEKKAREKEVGNERVKTGVKAGIAKSLEIGLSPIVTEKSVLMQENNVMAFRVNQGVGKGQVEEAVASQYGVKPLSVRLMVVRPKSRRRGNTYGRTRSWKKAYVKVEDVQTFNVGP